MPVSGKGRKGILVIGEAPGREEDEQNKPFVGEAGRLLSSTSIKLGIDLRRDCWIYNSLICRPPKNRTPSVKEIGYCRPNVLRTIKELQPTAIILLGKTPVRSVIGHLWKENVDKLERWVGWQIPAQRYNAWVCPTFHPAALLYAKQDKPNYPVMEMMFQNHLQAAFEKESRPFEEVPDYARQVEIILDPEQAAKIIRQMQEKGWPVAFDYETDRLKPDRRERQIVTCSISWKGRRTIAYPWMGEAIAATREMILSPVPKIASNMKFEDRWTYRVFGVRVRNWYWDTMLGAHTIDNRKKITSIKFQAFVLLGQEDYDSHIHAFLKAKGGSNSQNRIREVPLKDLLLYNGMDSLLEYKVAVLQMKALGYPLP